MFVVISLAHNHMFTPNLVIHLKLWFVSCYKTSNFLLIFALHRLVATN